ncbi:hypothetical protein P3L10_026192 [Capsicum annuum]
MAECTNFLAYKLQILHIGGCKGSQNSAKQHAYLKRSKSAQFSISSKSHSAKGPYADIATENSAWSDLNSSFEPPRGPSNYGLGSHSVNPLTGHHGNYNLPPLFENAADAYKLADYRAAFQ